MKHRNEHPEKSNGQEYGFLSGTINLIENTKNLTEIERSHFTLETK